MKFKHFFFSKQFHIKISKPNRISPSPSHSLLFYQNAPLISTSSLQHLLTKFTKPISLNPNITSPISLFSRKIHSLQQTIPNESDSEEEDGPMTEFLSRFVWIMRGKLAEVYPDCDKETINGMLLIIAEKVVEELDRGGIEEMLGAASSTPSVDFSEDLWKTVWEVSNLVLEDMKKEEKKEKMKKFIQSEEVKEMCKFASEVGVRGNMLREMRFKWAKEKMEEDEFYENLKRMRDEERERIEEEEEMNVGENSSEMVNEYGADEVVEGERKGVTLPQRRGKIKYKIYGLDMSNKKWADMVEKICDAEKLAWPEEPKPITGKCKLVTGRILSLSEGDDASPLLAEWVELLQPSRVDWFALLDKLKESNVGLYFKVAEKILEEDSFQANIRDYSKLIDAHAKDQRTDDAERILEKMIGKGIQPDILTSTILVHMYSKAGNLDRAKEEFERLKSQGFQPDLKVYESMIMAYVNSGEPNLGESLMRQMEARDIQPTMEIYMALLRSFSGRGLVDGAKRITITMQFAGFQTTLESGTLLVEAYAQAGDPDQARANFDYMRKAGLIPDDRCTAAVISVYAKKNLLDKALDLLLQLEKDGFEPGVETYTALVDWLAKLQLVDEAEALLEKTTVNGQTPPLKAQVSLCVLYARTRNEKKALQALGTVEGKKDLLSVGDFERIIDGLIFGGFVPEARRLQEMMVARGFTVSEALQVSLMSSHIIRRNLQRPSAK